MARFVCRYHPVQARFSAPEIAYLIYRDCWPVEQVPLAAKQMIGLHRYFVFAPETCLRLPELGLLTGTILTYVAAVLPPVPTAFRDREPKLGPGRLRRVLAQADFPNLSDSVLERRKKNSVTGHLLKGIDAHRRTKQAACSLIYRKLKKNTHDESLKNDRKPHGAQIFLTELTSLLAGIERIMTVWISWNWCMIKWKSWKNTLGSVNRIFDRKVDFS